MTRTILYFILSGFFVINLCSAQNKISFTQNQYDSIKIILEKVFDKDQNIRRIIQDSLKPDSPDLMKFVRKMIIIDSINQKIVIPIIEKYGILSKSKIGEKANNGIFYVIQHSNLDIMDKYFPQYDSLAKIGEASKRLSAMMEDRLLMWKGLKQKYGTQATTIKYRGNKLVIWPIEQPDKVDSLRKVVGFNSSIEDQAKGMGAIYDPNEKLPDKK